jgi:hypothetical protein
MGWLRDTRTPARVLREAAERLDRAARDAEAGDTDVGVTVWHAIDGADLEVASVAGRAFRQASAGYYQTQPEARRLRIAADIAALWARHAERLAAHIREEQPM